MSTRPEDRPRETTLMNVLVLDGDQRAALAVTRSLVQAGRLARDAEVVIYNTGSGASYR